MFVFVCVMLTERGINGGNGAVGSNPLFCFLGKFCRFGVQDGTGQDRTHQPNSLNSLVYLVLFWGGRWWRQLGLNESEWAANWQLHGFTLLLLLLLTTVLIHFYNHNLCRVTRVLSPLPCLEQGFTF